MAVAVPPALRERRQFVAQHVVIYPFELRVAAGAEYQEKILELQAADCRELEFEQRRLAGVGIHRMHFRRTGKRIVEGIAAGAGNHQHPVVGLECEGAPVYGRVFPAGVIYK